MFTCGVLGQSMMACLVGSWLGAASWSVGARTHRMPTIDLMCSLEKKLNLGLGMGEKLCKKYLLWSGNKVI